MVLLSVALPELYAPARWAHVGTLGPLKAKCSSSSILPFGPLWHSLAPFGMEAKLSAKAPLALLAAARKKETVIPLGIELNIQPQGEERRNFHG